MLVSSPVPVQSIIYEQSEPVKSSFESVEASPEPATVQILQSHLPVEIESQISEKKEEMISDADREAGENETGSQPKQDGSEDSTHNDEKHQEKSTTTVAGLKSGSAAYNIPTVMIENESSPVDLWIDASLTVMELREQLGGFLNDNLKRAIKRTGRTEVKSKQVGTTPIYGKEILIGKKMYAELTGPDFEIEPSGMQAQTYIEGRGLRWSWLVKPKHKSDNGIPLEIRVLADPGEGQTPVETIREVVIVSARTKTWKELIEELDWWIKLLGGSGVSAIFLWVFKWLFAKFKNSGDATAAGSGQRVSKKPG